MKRANLSSIKFEALSQEPENLFGGFSVSLTTSSFDDGSGHNGCCQLGNCTAVVVQTFQCA